MNELHQKLAEMFDNYEIYVRSQNETHTLAEMQLHQSVHGIDEDGEELTVAGVCASDKLGETNFGGAGLLENIVFLKGNIVEEIYDGVVIYPTEIICEMTPAKYESFLQFVEAY